MFTGKVAIVDDEPLLVKILGELLGREGIQVETFLDASEAINSLIPHLNQYSCVITDLDMPEISGLDLAAKVREVSFDFPVVVSTGDVNNLEEEDVVKYRINAIIRKPFTKTELFKSLKGIVNIPIHTS